ncbi:hypothetical protein M501DRAFT_946557, partial [Patellaria atrata CBS 101060]
MTPPPSSQMPALVRSTVRTPTPPTPHLSSPPPTLSNPNPIGAVRSSGTNYTSEQVANASAEELRAMVNELTQSLRETRMSAAHYKMQYNMLSIDSAETFNRMSVELAMAQREVDVFEEKRRIAANRPSSAFGETTSSSVNANLVNDLSKQCQTLQSENDQLKRDLNRANEWYKFREGEVVVLLERCDRLRSRIRVNREHLNGMFDSMQENDGRLISSRSTPMISTPRQRNDVRAHTRREQPFEALLLADKVLRQETVTAPTTPIRAEAPKHRFGHTRATHSLSSMPTTPNRSRPVVPSNAFRTPPSYVSNNTVPQSAPAVNYQKLHGRRESSDSTITASSVEGGQGYSDADEIPESQASQAATSMLRRTPASSKHSSFSKVAKAPQSSGRVLQSKIFGQVKKPNVDRSSDAQKRRADESNSSVLESPSKRSRFTGGVGLGIGGL